MTMTLAALLAALAALFAPLAAPETADAPAADAAQTLRFRVENTGESQKVLLRIEDANGLPLAFEAVTLKARSVHDLEVKVSPGKHRAVLTHPLVSGLSTFDTRPCGERGAQFLMQTRFTDLGASITVVGGACIPPAAPAKSATPAAPLVPGAQVHDLLHG